MTTPSPLSPLPHKTDLEIAREAQTRPIEEIAATLGISRAQLIPYGHDKAKLSQPLLSELKGRSQGKLILVTAISPTPAGEGKTTTTVGLADGLRRIGARAVVALREPSLGPNFGMKGGAAGGGRAQVVPMEDINLHFTGDFHAITAAHNLLAAMIDNHIYWGNELEIDERRVVWRRVVDMNDRALREVVVGLGGVSNGFPRQTGFDITVASEVMAILCLADDLGDLERRLGRMVVAYTRDREPITCHQLGAEGAMAALLKDAALPNLVQTLEGTPALIHGGPFANIAHGCNSLIATRAALALSDFVVTEAGFGADLGAEKFMNIKCRKGGLSPSAVVLVATVRALKMSGGVPKGELGVEDVGAVERGCANLGRHLENLALFGVPVVVSINHFTQDTPQELAAVQAYAAARGVEAVIARHWAEGGEGVVELARRVVQLAEGCRAPFTPLYADDLGLFEKIKVIAQRIYRAGEVVAEKKVLDQLRLWESQGHGALPICMAKTQYSFSTDPNLRGAPTGHSLTVREVRLSAGAGFVVAICGEIMTMPGLPAQPAALNIRLDDAGRVEGLF